MNAFFKIRWLGGNKSMCITRIDSFEFPGNEIKLNPCHGGGGNQVLQNYILTI